MSKWSDVGNWLKNNAGAGTTLVGSLLTGNVAGAVAAGVALVSGATGTSDPDAALAQLQTNPDTMLKLKELYFANEADIRKHIEAITKLQLEDAQAEQHETQETIRSGDNAEDVVVRRTRPYQSWCSLIFSFIYVSYKTWNDLPVDTTVLMALLALPWAYAGLRQIGKGIDSFTVPKEVAK
jgi:hypothetical protein